MNCPTKNPPRLLCPPRPACRAHLALACVAAAASPVLAQAQPAHLLDCMIQPSQVVLLGSAAPGVVERIAADRGDRVEAGQVVATLDARIERAALAVARERASQVGEASAARSAQDLAVTEYERAKESYAQNFISKAALEKAAAEVQGSGGRAELATEKQRLALREVELAQAQLAQRTIRSPVAGVVVERMASPGELVDQKPMLRIASVDPLRVDVLVPAAAFGQVEAGRKASVMPELFNQSTHMATVKTVDRVVDAASNTFRVRLELPNPKGALPAGLRCRIDLGLKLPDASSVLPVAANGRQAVPVATSSRPLPVSAAMPASTAAPLSESERARRGADRAAPAQR